MTNDDWILHLNKPLKKCDVLRLASLAEENKAVESLTDLSLYQDHHIAFRAAWVLECCVKSFSAKGLSNFIETYTQLTHFSCKRHFTKILFNILKRPEVNVMSLSNLERIVECTFEWLIDPKTPVAVQANCIDVLYSLKSCADWIDEELRAQLIILSNGARPAIRTRAKSALLKIRFESIEK